jgi:hypothetical protein
MSNSSAGSKQKDVSSGLGHKKLHPEPRVLTLETGCPPNTGPNLISLYLKAVLHSKILLIVDLL